MSGVSIKKVTVLNNPARFTDPFSFEVTYEALQDLDDDLEWKVTYLSSPNDASLDQELENVLVGPISSGIYKFVLEAEAPDGTKVPSDDLIGNTGVVLSCSFHDQEFVRVGFFIHVDYDDEELSDSPPDPPLYDKSLPQKTKPNDHRPLSFRLMRNVALDDPRVTTRPLDPTPLPTPTSDAPSVQTAEQASEIKSDAEMVSGVERSEEMSGDIIDRPSVADI